MKKYLSLLFIPLFLSFAFTFSSNNSLLINNVVIQFEGTNGNGNNLWLDNFTIGTRYGNDLTISAFNIKDKNYLLPQCLIPAGIQAAMQQ